MRFTVACRMSGNGRTLPLSSIVRVVAAATVLLVASVGTVGAQASSAGASTVSPADMSRAARQGNAARTPVAPTIDGLLDEAEWSLAPAMTDFIQRIPMDGAPANERTEVRVLFDAPAIYVGVWMFDPSPEQIVLGPRVRDYDLTEADAVTLVFETFGDGQNGFVFATTPAGIEYDGQVANEGQSTGRSAAGGRQLGGAGAGFNLNWDGSWTVATSVHAEGWFAEFRIPFSTLRFATGKDLEWGFNVLRRVRRTNEESSWSFVPRQFPIYRLSFAGVLAGIEPPGGRLVSVIPYALTAGRRDFVTPGATTQFPFEYGADAKVQVTSELTLDLTWNTDFAQVEVDDAQVNLTRFNLFFPEKRPFFLENSGFFAIGSGESQLFFSRNLGIARGQQVPLLGGGRLSGRAAGFNVGMLHLQSDEVAGLQDRNAYSVFRLARELPGRSRIGMFAAERNAASTPGFDNRTFAVDGQLGVGRNVTMGGILSRTATPGRTGDETGVELTGIVDARNWKWTADFRRIGDEFNPELGFLPRANYTHLQVTGQRYVRPKELSWFREGTPHFTAYTYRNNETGFEESARFHLEPFPMEFHGGGKVSVMVDAVREGLTQPFTIAPGVVIPPGTYDTWEYVGTARTNPAAPFAMNGRVNTGTFLTGTRTGGQLGVTYRLGGTVLASITGIHWDVALPQGRFDATLIAGRLGIYFTPRIFLQSIVQYNDQADLWSANARFGWLGAAGTGLFLVINETQGLGLLDESGPRDRSVLLKYSRLINLFGG